MNFEHCFTFPKGQVSFEFLRYIIRFNWIYICNYGRVGNTHLGAEDLGLIPGTGKSYYFSCGLVKSYTAGLAVFVLASSLYIILLIIRNVC